RNSEPEIVAYAIDDGLRAAIRIVEGNAPCDVCLFREHCRNPYSSIAVRNRIGTRNTRASPRTPPGLAISRAFAVRGFHAPLLSDTPNFSSASWESDLFSTRGL